MGISTHILDTGLGRPAGGVPVSLATLKGGEWIQINEAATDGDGRCKYLLPERQKLHPGIYRIRFETGSYYSRDQVNALYPYVEVAFTVLDGETHYHIPLLLTANGYTTYRGS